MLIFLDESGDCGFNFEKTSSSRYLIFTAFVCANSDMLPHLNRVIRKTIKNKVNHKKSAVNELKGSNSNIQAKHYFYKLLVKNNDWRLHSIIADKHTWLKKQRAPFHKDKFYDAVLIKLLTLIKYPIKISTITIVIDRSKTNAQIEKFNTNLRARLKNILHDKIECKIFHDESNIHAGLQIADIFCWGIHRKLHLNDDEWYNVYANRITTHKF